MSWLSDNYEKVALGVAALAVVGVGYSVFSGNEKVPDPKTITPLVNIDIPQSENLADGVSKYRGEGKYKGRFTFDSKVADGNEVTSFIAYPLYSIKGQEALTSLDKKYEIHEGMPIEWWNKYSLEDYTQENGPDLDPDGDGFTNREEMNGGTNPTLANDCPDYLHKLKVDGTSPAKYEISWTQIEPGKGNFKFKYNGINYRYERLGIGAIFPDKEIKKPNFVNRFEIIGKEQDPAITGDPGQYFLIKDKLKTVDNVFKVHYRERVNFNDWKAKMSVDISVPEVNKQFSLSEGDRFSLPFDENAKDKPYTFLYHKDNKLYFDHSVKGLKKPHVISAPN